MVPGELLKNLKVFKEAPAAALEHLAGAMEMKTYHGGEIICREGEKGTGLFLIAQGSVTVEKRLFQGDNSTKVVARLGREEFFGEMAFLQNQPHSATVSAQEETTVLFLSRASLDELIKKDPKIALDQVLTVMTGLSDRLRSTTRELITVFEVARVVGLSLTIDDLARRVVSQLGLNLAPAASIAFFRWNPYNDEYALMTAGGPHKSVFPPAFEPGVPPQTDKGIFVFSYIDMSDRHEGLLLFYGENASSFSPGERQMIETVSAVLAPALSTARLHEEEAARQRLQRIKQQGTYL